MAGYEFTIDHRMGGEDGPTEWRFTSCIPELKERIAALQGLNHRFLCGFNVEPDREVHGFCIRQAAPERVFPAVVRYLGAWPDEAKEYLRQVNAEPFPAEVLRRIWGHFRPEAYLARAWDPDAAWQPDPRFISAERKLVYGRPAPGFPHSNRGEAWDLTLAYGRSVGIGDSAWRKCHTERYWAWFAAGLQDQP